MLIRSHAIRNGIILFLLLGLYFLILDAIGSADNLFLILVNYVFIFGILNITIKQAVKNGETYLNKLAIGIVTVFIAITLGALSLYLYLQALEPILERYVSVVMMPNSYAGLCLALFVQSLTSSMILVFIMLQFYKNR